MVDEKLWETDPARAAKLAFLETSMMWQEQVEQGIFGGVPALTLELAEDHTRPLKVVLPDTDAGVHAVPDAVKRLFERLNLAEQERCR